MSTHDPLLSLLHDTRELEGFLHDFIERLAKRGPQPGEDVTRFSEEFGLKMPPALKGAKITWAEAGDDDVTKQGTGEQMLVLSRPGQFDALGFTIGCIRIGRDIKACIECGWFYCRIVIKGRF